MISLSSTLMVLQARTATAINTTQPVAHVWYYDVPARQKVGMEEYQRGMQRTVMTDTTDITICAAPPDTNVTRNIYALCINNRSLDTEIFTISTFDATNRYPLVTRSALTLEAIWYEDEGGWQNY